MHTLVQEAHAGARRLFRWGVVDTLGPCTDAHACRATPTPEHPEGLPCPLLPECAGRAKQRDPDDAGHIPVADAIAMKRRVSATTWNTEMLCLRPTRSHTVFPEFDHARHVVRGTPWLNSIPAAIPAVWIAGMDFGLRAPTVILWAVLDLAGTLWIVDERAESNIILAEHAAAITAGLARPGIAAWPSPAWIGADPAGHARSDQTGVSAVHVLTAAGFKVRTARRPILSGLELVRARLAPASNDPPRLFIHERCTTLIKTLETYHYPLADPFADLPEKDGPDHAADALRYLIQNLDGPPTTRRGDYFIN